MGVIGCNQNSSAPYNATNGDRITGATAATITYGDIAIATGTNTSIYQGGWGTIQGIAVSIAGKSSTNMWCVNSTGGLYQNLGSGWVGHNLPSGKLAQDVGAGTSSTIAWATSTTNEVYQWNGSTWTIDPAMTAKRIDVSNSGTQVWCVNASGQVYQKASGVWILKAGVTAQDVAVSHEDGEFTWVVGTDNNIYFWVGGQSGGWFPWINMQPYPLPTQAVRVGDDMNTHYPWYVDVNGQVYEYAVGWLQRSGITGAIDIAVPNEPWATGATVNSQNIYKWPGWTTITGSAVSISGKNRTTNLWCIDNTGLVKQLVSGAWVSRALPSSKVGLDIGAGSKVWASATDLTIYQWNGSSWDLKQGNAKKIDCDQNGNTWCIGSTNLVWQDVPGSGWVNRPLPSGALGLDIGVGNGVAAVITTTNLMYKWTGSAWQSVSGPAGSTPVRIAVGPLGSIWIVNSSGVVFFQDPDGGWKSQNGAYSIAAVDVAAVAY